LLLTIPKVMKIFNIFHGFTGSRYQSPFNDMTKALCNIGINVLRLEFGGTEIVISHLRILELS
ncbi:MAG: hypothetical protein QW685_08005, partial [Saccharolobus sp.]